MSNPVKKTNGTVVLPNAVRTNATATIPNTVTAKAKAPAVNAPVAKTAKVNIPTPTSKSATNGIILREQTKHMATLANSNILGNPLQPLMLYISRIAPDSLVENRPAWVEFMLWNRSSGQSMANLFVRATIQPKHSVDTYPGYFEFPVRTLSPTQNINGAISFVLPRADVGNTITIELCQMGEIPAGGEFPPINVLASDTSTFDVGAKFTMLMDDIQIRDTASIINDTLFVSFNGQFENDSFGDTSNLGDHDNTDGPGIDPKVLPVGPFTMIPGSARNIAVSCTIANAGHTSTEEDAKKALDTVSYVGAQIATAIMSIIFPVGAGVWAGLSEAANQLNQAIINWALADCDTVVLMDALLISCDKLFEYTFDTADNLSAPPTPLEWVMHTRKPAGTKLSDWLGGGCRDSDYTTGVRVERHRAPEMVHDSSIDGTLLAPNQVIGLGRVGPNQEQIIFDNEGDGIADIKGNYKAPAIISEQKFDVVKWTVYETNKNGIYPAYEDFTLVLLD